MSELVNRIIAGDRRALARLITSIENHDTSAEEPLTELFPYTGQAHIIGITGSPGAGKSTLVMQLAREFRSRGKTVGIIAVDPTSPFSGGAILGDRIRMQDISGDKGIFIRSMATRGHLGGLASTTRDVIRTLDAAKFDIIIIETVGTGQAEVEIIRVAHSIVVVTVPGMGDDIQAIKAGILEIADIFVVNKSDHQGSDQTVADLRILLTMAPNKIKDGWKFPIIKTMAIKNEGIKDVADALQKHREYFNSSDTYASKLQEQAKAELEDLIYQRFLSSLHRKVSDNEWDNLVNQIAARSISPYETAQKLITKIQIL